MSAIAVNTTYEPFSLEPTYVQANRGFIGRQPLSHVERFLDLACGTGTISELLLEASPSAHLCGVDYDPKQIELSTARFRQQGYEVRHGYDITDDVVAGKPVLTFAVGSADNLPYPAASFDCVTIAHAIHLLSDKAKLLNAIVRVLKHGGAFGFNSAYFAGCNPPATDRIYFDWLRLATDYIRALSAQRVAAGELPITRVRGTVHRAATNRWESPAEWRENLAAAGLVVHDMHERLVELDARCLALVGAYGGMAEVLLSGFPVEVASEALQATAQAALAASGAKTAPRYYLEVWATKQ
jgi:ubiquinone/menaquinone biosynthesis C-methylase UbiE